MSSNTIVRSVALFLIILTKSMAFAGGMEGGGGKGVVCRDPQGNIESVELLDLWEARTLYDYKISPEISEGGLAAGVDLVLNVLKNSYLEKAHRDGPFACVDQECVYQSLKYESDYFLKPHDHVKRLHGITLELTDDSYEIAKPNNACKIEQIVNYQRGGIIYINQDLYDHLNTINQIALIAHEAFYAILRDFRGGVETNSIRTRRAIGYVMSGQIFKLPNYAEKKDYLFCSNIGVPYAPTYIDFFMKKHGKTGQEYFVVSPSASMGTPFLGVEIFETIFTEFGRTEYLQFVSGKCQREGADNQFFTIRLDGPIEFDRELRLDWVCKDGSYNLFLTDSKPGVRDPVTVPMTCKSRP